MESITDIVADINKKYRCVSGNQIHMSNVTVIFHDATIQAYLSNNNFSKEGKTLALALMPLVLTPVNAEVALCPGAWGNCV